MAAQPIPNKIIGNTTSKGSVINGIQNSAKAVPKRLIAYVFLFPNLRVRGTKIKAISIVVVLYVRLIAAD